MLSNILGIGNTAVEKVKSPRDNRVIHNYRINSLKCDLKLKRLKITYVYDFIVSVGVKSSGLIEQDL